MPALIESPAAACPRPNRRPRWRALAAWALAAVLLLPALLRAEDYDRWYTVEIGGQRAGWMHNRQVTSGDRVETRSEVSFSISRGEVSISVSTEAEFVETTRGQPVSVRLVSKFGAMPTTLKAEYGEKDIAVEITSLGKTQASRRPLPEGEWLTPAAATAFVRQRLAAGAETIVLRTIEPGAALDLASILTPVTITHSGCAPATLEIMGKTVRVIRCTTTSSSQPGIESVEYYDDRGLPVRIEANLGGIRMVATVAERAEATAAHAGAELMVSTFVKPDRPIENPRQRTEAVYRLSIPEGAMPDLPSAASQKVERIGEREARVAVHTDRPAPAPAADLEDPALTRPSPMIDSDDEKVRSLLAAATRDAGEAKPARAEAMRRFVHRYIRRKDLGVGFASASETARTRQGDCTEHGVLLAALLRADGIPARVACGLVYADQFAGEREIFGYHLWTQALLEIDGERRWVDLDPTLSERTPFDATHIALAVSALGDGQSHDALLAIAALIGRLQISVESVK